MPDAETDPPHTPSPAYQVGVLAVGAGLASVALPQAFPGTFAVAPWSTLGGAVLVSVLVVVCARRAVSPGLSWPVRGLLLATLGPAALALLITSAMDFFAGTYTLEGHVSSVEWSKVDGASQGTVLQLLTDGATRRVVADSTVRSQVLPGWRVRATVHSDYHLWFPQATYADAVAVVGVAGSFSGVVREHGQVQIRSHAIFGATEQRAARGPYAEYLVLRPDRATVRVFRAGLTAADYPVDATVRVEGEWVSGAAGAGDFVATAITKAGD